MTYFEFGATLSAPSTQKVHHTSLLFHLLTISRHDIELLEQEVQQLLKEIIVPQHPFDGNCAIVPPSHREDSIRTARKYTRASNSF